MAASNNTPATKPAETTATDTTDSLAAPAESTYTVAAGRTVDGRKPGESVELNETDAARFRELGFILDEDGKQRFNTDGPAVQVEDGVQIKPAV